jgi:hypothetical protein
MSGFSAGSIVSRLELDTSGFNAGIAQSIGNTGQFSEGFKSIAGGAMDAFGEVAKRMANGFAAGVHLMMDGLRGFGNALGGLGQTWDVLTHAVTGGIRQIASGLSSLGPIGQAVGVVLNTIADAFDFVAAAAKRAVQIAGELAEKIRAVQINAAIAGVSESFFKGIAGAARESGIGAEELAHSLAFLSRNAAEAAEGNATVAASFAKLGVAVKDSAGNIRPTEAIFNDVVDAIAALPSSAQQAQAAMDLLSRGGLQMLPLLKHGTEAIREVQEELHAASGTPMPGLDEAADKFIRLEGIVEAGYASIKRTLAEPILKAIADNFEELKATFIEAFEEIRNAFKEAFKDVDWTAAIKEGIRLVKELVIAITKIDWGAVIKAMMFMLEILMKVIEGLAKVAGWISNIAGLFGGGGGGGVGGGLSLSDIKNAGAMTPASGLPTFTPAAASSDGGGGDAGGGRDFARGSRTFNYNVAVNADVSDSTLAVAEKIRGGIRQAMTQADRQAASFQHMQDVANGVGIS